MVTSKISKPGVIGIDEVGRGPLAGPVTVCAVYIEDETTVRKELFHGTIRDSKKVSKVKRNNIYITIRQNRYLNNKLSYAVSSRTAAYIDRYGINKAIQACLRSCVLSLAKQGVDITNIQINLDAGLIVPIEGLKQMSFIKGDERYTEIAIASIIAKASRDTYMEKLAENYEVYAWDKNAGYGTLIHRKAIEKYGITKYHRISYLKTFKLFDKAE